MEKNNILGVVDGRRARNLHHIVDWSIVSWPASRMIALGRLFMVNVAITAIYVDPPHPTENVHAIYGLLGIYFAFAILCVVMVYWRSPNQREQILSHAFDIAVISCLIYLSERPSSPFFVFFTFILLSSTLRWSWQGVVATTIILTSAFFVLFVLLVILDELPPGGPNEVGRVIVRAGYLVMAGIMLAYVSAYRERTRRRLTQLARWPGPDGEERHPLPIKGALTHVAQLMDVSRILIVWEEAEEPFTQVALWTPDDLQVSREPPDRFNSLVAPALVGQTFEVVSRSEDDGPKESSPDSHDPLAVDQLLRETFEIDCAITAPFNQPHCRGRVFLLDQPKKGDDDLVIAELVSTRIGMDLEHRILRDQVESMAAYAERVRLARDLHDGILQSLAAANIRLQLLSKQSDSAVGDRLEQIRHDLVDEQRRVRDFVEMNRLNPSDRTARVVLVHGLQDQFAKLMQQWDLNGTLTVLPPDLAVPSMLAHHVRHLLKEAVSNAVRHGKASRISVLAALDRGCLLQLHIEDDGKGFEHLEGQYDDNALSTFDISPRSLRARVKELGGALELETSPAGTILKMRVPLR
ncbi:sensor histidine kinase [Microvirga sp. M2]|uniref:sensor histidine kinase n=1 Tax=Microvirga sp. M2 TaxID=3073270 RepID=UPI0039C0F689